MTEKENCPICDGNHSESEHSDSEDSESEVWVDPNLFDR